MFRKLLNVGKGHSNEKLQQQQQQQKNLFQLNEIRSYGFSHLCCLGYSSSLSLLAVGSKYGLLRVLGNPSVEFSYQLESANTIRQIEFIDCRENNLQNNLQNGKLTQSKRSDQALDQAKKQASSDRLDSSADNNFITSAKIVVLTDNGQLHLFELRTFKQQNYSDGTTQTDNVAECCQQQQQQQQPIDLQATQSQEYTKLERVAQLDYFKYKLDDEDRSRRITTLEVSADGLIVFVGTEGGNLYQVPLSKFDSLDVKQQQQQLAEKQTTETPTSVIKSESANDESKEEETTAVNLNDEPQIEEVVEPFEMIRFDKNVLPQLNTLTSLDIDNLISKKQGAIESIKRHPTSSSKLLISYHRGLSVIFDIRTKSVDKFFYHNQVLESSCFADLVGDSFCTSHNDGSYIKWDARSSQVNAEDFLSQLYGPYPCKPAPKIQACTGLVNDQLEDLVIFSGGMPRATYDDKNSVTIVHTETGGKDTIKTVLDFTSKVLDFVVITRPRGNLGAGAKSTGAGGGGGKKNKHKKEQQQQQRNNPIAVALAILAEEEFVVIDLLNSESYLEFALPYLNCIHSSAITCNQHYSDVGDELYEQLLAYNKQQLKGKLSPNEWPITGGKVINAPEVKSHDILLTGHEDGSVDFWDVSDLSMRHLLHLSTARFFSTSDDDLVPIDGSVDNNNKQDEHNQDTAVAISNGTTTANNENSNANQQDAWPPLKRVGRFDPYSDDTRLAVRRLSLCPQTGTLVVAGTGGK